jgi:protein-L-isoaspartate(D-aspartate) O-methyltransferase
MDGAMRILSALAVSFALVAAPSPLSAAEDDEIGLARAAMVELIRLQAAATAGETGIAEIDPRVLEAMRQVPRHEFVPEPLRRFAYADTPLPLGHGQSLTQPYIAALMTHLLRIGADDVVFETGTDTGYHAAVLARLAKRVASIEVIAPLAMRAAHNLERLGYAKTVDLSAADGYFGWAEKGPFDAILLKEAVDVVPPPLLAQLKRGGRLVAPVGPLSGMQMLTLFEKDADGRVRERAILPVRFAPLQGGERI